MLRRPELRECVDVCLFQCFYCWYMQDVCLHNNTNFTINNKHTHTSIIIYKIFNTLSTDNNNYNFKLLQLSLLLSTDNKFQI